MGTKPKRKKPITAGGRLTTGGKQSLKGTSHKVTQAVIQRFHVLLKRKSVLERDLKQAGLRDANVISIDEQLKAVSQEIDSLGGLDAYQEASTLGQDKERGGDSSKVLIEWLKESNESYRSCEPAKTDGEIQKRPMRMLEIGALSPDNFAARQPYITNTPIDLNSRHPHILKQDFMERPLPSTQEERFDLVSCSLVLNFVPLAEERGRMLRLIRQQLLPSSRSYLFLVLPLPCVTNSRYLTEAHLTDLMNTVGFEVVKSRYKQGGKVGYWLFRWRESTGMDAKSAKKFAQKTVINEGPKRNNFAILLREDGPTHTGS